MEECNNHCNTKIVRFMQPSIPESIVNELGWKMESIVLMTEDQPHRHWLIILEGGRHFKSGWKDFCDHHHLNVGSTPYSRFNCMNINQTQVGGHQVAQVGQQIPPVQPQFPTCHITVTYKSRNNSVVYLPRWFITSSGLRNRCCFLKLIDEKENPWEVKLLNSKYNGYSYITGGWKKFLISNNIKPRSVVSIQAIQAGMRPILKVSQVTLPPKRFFF
ncbi:B3 domain-containing protein REM9-like [Silene latifolia]|uniref:B3 domain-containing protein REM9-like n=1 Tax=Silene latifolia TaxID=37657 RepID=UPI003D785AAB